MTELTELDGAVGDPPEHYGNPVGEQRALASGRAVVLVPRGVVTVSGPDRLSWLDSLTSQRLTGLQPGESAETLLLDPTGRIEHVMRVLDDGETAYLLVEPEEAEPLAAWLARMRFTLRVEVADATDRFAVFGTLGAAEGVEPAAPAGIRLVWEDPWRAVVAGGHQYALTAEHPGAEWSYRELLVEREALADASAAAVERGVAGTVALEALRIAAWRPRFATEVDERSIPHELDWLRSAVHLTKGCYRGQETVAKVHNLGHPPRRLVLLQLDGAVPAPGAEVLLGETVVGRVTSAAMHHEQGPIALAVVKRSVNPSASLVVLVDDLPVAAAQELIVPPEAGATADIPRIPRLGSRR